MTFLIANKDQCEISNFFCHKITYTSSLITNEIKTNQKFHPSKQLIGAVASVRQRAVLVEKEEEQLPPQPYEFSYAAAGRAPGHIDRAHAESRDEFGVVRGKSY
jgi:hypothetical protein